jgi:CBS domain-containing protein
MSARKGAATLWFGAPVYFEGETITRPVDDMMKPLYELSGQHNGALRRSADVAYVQTFADVDDARAVRRTDLKDVEEPIGHCASGGTTHCLTRVPEVAWKSSSVSSSVPSYEAAHGIGTVKDAYGCTLYSGTFAHGMRHGNGRAAIFARAAPDAPADYVGEYDGDWVLGMRHGKGSFSEDNGSRYDGGWAHDRKHGSGVETISGGGIYRGAWCRGKRHGCGSFTWPNGRVELREYDHGSLVAARLVSIVAPSSGQISRVASGGAFPPPQRVLSAQSLAALGAAASSSTSGSSASMPGQLAIPSAIGDSDRSVSGGVGGSSGSVLAVGTAVHDSFHDENDASYTELMETAAAIGLPLHSIPMAATPAMSFVSPSMQASGIGSFATHTTVTAPGVLPGAGVTVPVSVKLNADVLRLLRHSSASDLPGGRDSVVHATTKDTVEKCLTQMTEHNVLSMPIFDESSGKYVAMVHVLDIFALMLDLVAKKKATFSPASGGLRETLAHQKRFAQAPITEVLAMASHLYPITFKPLPAGCPLIYPAQVLAEGVHAVPIVDPSGKIVRIITQADIIRFLAAHLDEMGPLSGLTVSELGLAGYGAGDLVIAHFDDKAFDVLSSMRTKKCAAAPVVDTYGAMVANLSFSDVKAIAKKANFSVLQLPIQQFFTAIEKAAEVSRALLPFASTNRLLLLTSLCPSIRIVSRVYRR